MTFDEARNAIDAIIAAERADERIDPIAYTRCMTHGAATDRAITFYHGFTNCPQQFVELGKLFYNAGYNVYIPRMPGHGMRDKMTTALKGLSLRQLTAAAVEAAATTGGLGSRVHVAGISMGGVLAAWVDEQAAVASATAIAPFFAIAGLPMWVTTALAALLEIVPNFFIWWDPRTSRNNPAVPPYAYPRYPSHALAEQLRISAQLQRTAQQRPPAARVSALFLNRHEPAVNNAVAQRLLARWAAQGARVLQQIFDGGRLPHDIIDNFRGNLPVDRIYPAILDFVEQADALAIKV